ncbi:MAG: hypothetical protein AAFV95_15865 [Bacteroidota bacterium]
MANRSILDEDELDRIPPLEEYLRYVGMIRIFVMLYLGYRWIDNVDIPPGYGGMQIFFYFLGLSIPSGFLLFTAFYNLRQAGMEIRRAPLARAPQRYRLFSTVSYGIIIFLFVGRTSWESFTWNALMNLSLPSIILISMIVICLTDIRYYRYEDQFSRRAVS